MFGLRMSWKSHNLFLLWEIEIYKKNSQESEDCDNEIILLQNRKLSNIYIYFTSVSCCYGIKIGYYTNIKKLGKDNSTTLPT